MPFGLRTEKRLLAHWRLLSPWQECGHGGQTVVERRELQDSRAQAVLGSQEGFCFVYCLLFK